MSKLDRDARIAEAAYAVLAAKGYGGASMLSIAKAAGASNETLYRWYGDKCGLFTALARRNARLVRARLDLALETDGDAAAALRDVAPLLLGMLLDDPAILLNRAAAGDPTGALGRAIAEGGRDDIAPRVAGLIGRVLQRTNRSANVGEATRQFLDLLVGDLQIRRVIGTLPRPDAAFVETRAEAALTAFATLTAADQTA